jgi:hypothetical protein
MFAGDASPLSTSVPHGSPQRAESARSEAVSRVRKPIPPPTEACAGTHGAARGSRPGAIAWYAPWYGVEVDKRLKRLLDLLDAAAGETVNTSVRLPVSLRDAAALVADMGLAASTTELTVRGLRDTLEAYAQRAVLDAHYRAHPEARPTLAEVARAAAELDGNPLAYRPDLIDRAADAVAALKDDPGPDDVLLYAAGLAAAA